MQPANKVKSFYLKYFLVVFVLIITTNIFAQDSVIAKVGPLKITKEEFTERYELVPQLSKPDGQTSNKYNLLYSLIAEKLWALEAEHENLDTALVMQTAYKSIEKMFVRDALYKIEIANKVKITDKEIFNDFKKYFSDLSVSGLIELDSASIYDDYNQLNSGIAFDSLVKIYNKVVDTTLIKYGEMDENNENLFYGLKVNDYTAPVNTGNSWATFKLNDIKTKSYNSDDISVAAQKVKKVIGERKTEKVYDNYLNKFLEDMHVETDGDIFWRISDLLTNELSNRKLEEAIPDSQNVSLKDEDILKIESELGKEILKKPFIKFKKNPITTEVFLKQFLFDGFYLKKVDEKIVSGKLNTRVKTFIESELLAREGYRRGLQNLPEVRSQLDMWRLNYLAKLFKQKLIDSVKVTNDEAYQYYLTKNESKMENPPEVNILEILTDSLDVAEKVLDEIKDGMDFRRLASMHTKRKWTKDNGGEFGFFPSTMYGEIGSTAAKMKIGEVYGPLKVKEGYSIIKLIGKKDPEKNNIAPFDSVKNEMKKEALYQKLSKYIIDYTAKLANKYNVKIDKTMFDKLQLKDLKTYAFRYMGFGGRITAVPPTINFTEWVPLWENGQKVNP